jgi:uncharacterized repeat protein (TIGR02543 family)
MKTVNRFFGNLNRARCAVPLLIIALAVIMSFAFAACDDGNNPQTKTCTVTFNADGGTPAPAQQTVDSGGKVTEPPAMTKAGYTFGGWFKESTFTNQWNFATDTVTASLTLYAKWIAEGTITYTVTFNSNGGSAVQTQTVASGEKAAEPQNVTKNGYTLAGWFRDDTAFQNQWNFATDTVTQDITLYAKWDVAGTTNYTVTFNSNGGSAVQAQTVASGAKAAEPQNVTRNGYTLAGWFRDDTAFQNQWNFATDTVTASLTLYAKWIAEGTVTYTVTFNSNGGSAVQSQTVASGEKAAEPQNVTRNGYTLAGWYRDDTAFQNQWNFATDAVTASLTLYAKWIAEGTATYTITFNSNGGSAVQAQTVASGGNATEPQNVTRNGYTLAGWFRDDTAFQNQWNFATDTVTQDITLYAKWNENAPATVTVTFDTDGGSNVNSQTVETGGYINRPNNPTKTGYTFVDWYTSTEYEYIFNFNIPINSSRTAYAKWTINQYTVTFNSNGGSAVTVQTVDHGEKATEPQGVTRSGHLIAGWYRDDDTFQNQWYFATDTVTQNITLYAKWTINTYTVIFNSNGGSTVSSITGVIHGNKITKPIDPTRTGSVANIFIGWYDQSLSVPFYFDTPITDNITLYAKWDFPIQLGSTGPGGGKVFYRSETGFYSGGIRCYYLEAAPEDISRTLRWSSPAAGSRPNILYIGNTYEGIGDGRSNTDRILSRDADAPAAKACKDYRGPNNLNDWFLPSRNELEQLYINRSYVGTFTSNYYWSSKEDTSPNGNYTVYAYGIHFGNGTNTYIGKDSEYMVRAVRAF